ncbi:MAG: HigA family addiction module antitoxin [Limisphaerales bacterium]
MTSGASASGGRKATHTKLKSSTIIKAMGTRKNKLPPVHPGEVLREEFMKPLKLSASAVAKGLGVTQATVRLLIRGRRGVSAELALRLARYVGTTAEFWIGLQGQYDLDVAQDETEERIAKEVQRCPLLPAAA